MKNIKVLYLIALAAWALFFVACSDDDDDSNQITIIIVEPLDGETISDCAAVLIHLDVEATDENHELEVVLHPEGDVEDKIIDYDQHSHDADIQFEQEVNLCDYPAGTCFHLEVEACIDHDCEEKETAEAEFCLS